MPGEDGLRTFYPQILTITLEDVYEIAEGDPKVQFYLTTIYNDLIRAKNRQFEFEGWTNRFNPFLSIDLNVEGLPPMFTDEMQVQYNMTLRANEWFGIGVWSLAEEYYKIAINLALTSNDVIAALQNGANLALCYLGGNDCDNALRISKHLLPATIQSQNSYASSGLKHQITTTLRMCFVKSGKYDLAERKAKWLRNVSPNSTLLDGSINTIITDVLESINDIHKLQIWRNDWQKLQELNGGTKKPCTGKVITENSPDQRSMASFWKKVRKEVLR